jgi:putative FmdB family regulatory protein
VPIYEFECGECGERFEELVPAGTEHATCPSCGTAGAERRLSSFGLSRQPTAGQRRRMEDARGTNRDGARQRFKQGLSKARESRPKPPRGGAT